MPLLLVSSKTIIYIERERMRCLCGWSGSKKKSYTLYIIFSLAHWALTGVLGLWRVNCDLKRALGRQVGLSRRTWTPSWAVQGHLGAKLGCQGALGLPLGIQLGIQAPLQSAPTPQNDAPVQTRTQIQQIALCALQLLLGCFLAALGACLGGFWAQLGASWAPLGLTLGPLGRLWG